MQIEVVHFHIFNPKNYSRKITCSRTEMSSIAVALKWRDSATKSGS
jgi:hypothetical protein